MGLFGRHRRDDAAADRPLSPGALAVQVPGLAEAAASWGWRRLTEDDPVGSELADQVHRLAWIMHGITFSSDLLDATDTHHQTIYREVWSGTAGEHRCVVAHAWTDIGPQGLRF
jgi:hypothetical protein